jgi:hypothetical protein
MNKDILEGNKLIAEFMPDMKPFENPYRKIKKEDGFYIRYNIIDGSRSIVGDIKYHTSWDWIMPVVERIGEDYEFMIDTYAGIEVSEKPMQSILAVDRDESIPLIHQTWLAVVEFIKWYNQNPNYAYKS